MQQRAKHAETVQANTIANTTRELTELRTDHAAILRRVMALEAAATAVPDAGAKRPSPTKTMLSALPKYSGSSDTFSEWRYKMLIVLERYMPGVQRALEWIEEKTGEVREEDMLLLEAALPDEDLSE